MKTLFSAIVLMLVCMCGCSTHFIAKQEASGTVSISFFFNKSPANGENQVAVWIEDLDGNYVKSLLVTPFAADGGFKQRPEMLPEWVGTSGWENATQAEVDAVSGASHWMGFQIVKWDLTDQSGKPVYTGTYIYKVEGNISRADRVVWQGSIDVRGKENTSVAKETYYPAEASEKELLLEEVEAAYVPL